MVFHAPGSPLSEIGSPQDPAEGAGTIPSTNASPLKVGLDYERYAALLADHQISEEDKRALLDSLWSIISSFVQLGFHVHPVQQAADARDARRNCGQAVKSPSELAQRDPFLLTYKQQKKGGL